MNEPTGQEVRKYAVTPAEYALGGYAREMRRRFEYYQGHQFVHEAQALDELPDTAAWAASWSGSGWEDIKALLPDIYDKQYIHPVGIRFVTIIVDNKQIVYTVPPDKRMLVLDGKVDEQNSALLKRIYDAAGHDAMADQLCRWTGLFHTAFQYVGWDTKYRRIVKRNLKPYEVFVIPSPEAPTDLQHEDCFIAIAQSAPALTRVDAKLNRVVWQCWWRDEYWYEEHPGHEYMDPMLTEPGRNPNPYRDEDGNTVKPILVTHESPSQNVYYHGPDNLVLQNQRLDRALTALAHTMEYQGFSVPVATGMDYEEAAKQGWSPGSLWVLPGVDADLSFKHPAAQVGEFYGAILKKARMFARLEGVDPEVVDPEVRIASGVSKAQSRRVLAEKREEQFPKWRPYERESYWLTSIVWNTFARANKLPEIARFEDIEDPSAGYQIEIEFGELDPIVDPLADILEKKNRLATGLNTRAEIIAAERRIPLVLAEKLADQIKTTNEADGISFSVDASMASNQRIGQSGNRPRDEGRQPGRSGNTNTADSGNAPVAQAAVGQIRGGDTT